MFALALNNEARSDYESLRASILSTIVGGLKTMKKVSKYELIAQAMPTDPRFVDLTGQRFGRLVVEGYAGKRGGSNSWNCVCDCGVVSQVFGGNLSRGLTTSCGCRRVEASRENATTHNDSGKELHRVWKNIRNRCHNPKSPSYKNYGGRGITLSEELASYSLFKRHVLEVLGPRPTPQHSIDRADNSKGYEPGNLRWATAKEQANNRRSNLSVTLFGVPMKMAEVCAIFDMPYALVMERINRRGWSLARALTESLYKPKVKNPPRGAPPN